jgi:ribosomal protein S13
MARLVGVDLPRDKRLEVALTYIYGIGRTRAFETLEATGVSADTRVHQLSDEDIIRRFKPIGGHIRRPCATNGVSTLRGDEESACAHKLDDPLLPRKAPVELTADVRNFGRRRASIG